MARYINEDEFIAWVKEHWCADCQNDNGLRCRVCWIDDAIDIVEEAPEADVVPKSEVEELQAEVGRLEKENAELLVSETTDIRISMEKLVKVRTEHPIFKAIKEKVAREIFEEIEDVLNNIGYFDELDFKALKKKYTEDNDGNSN